MKGKASSMTMFVVSLAGVLLAILDSFGVDVWLSANTWLIIAAVVGIWAIYFEKN